MEFQILNLVTWKDLVVNLWSLQ